MEIDGLVAVKVEADLEPFRTALAQGRKEAEQFDKEVGEQLAKAGSSAASANHELADSAKEAAKGLGESSKEGKGASKALDDIAGSAKKAATETKSAGSATKAAMTDVSGSAVAASRGMTQYSYHAKMAFDPALQSAMDRYVESTSNLGAANLKTAAAIASVEARTATLGPSTARLAVGLQDVIAQTEKGTKGWTQYNIAARESADPAFAARQRANAAAFAQMFNGQGGKGPPIARIAQDAAHPLFGASVPKIPDLRPAAAGADMMTGALVRLIPVAIAAATALAGFFAVSKYIEQSKEFEDTQMRLAMAIKNTGNVAGQSQAGLKAQADAIEEATSIAGSEVQKAQITMLKFKRVNDDVFTDAIKVAADYSVFMQVSMPAAAQKLGRVLEDPIRGVKQLREAGVNFTKDQEKAIKAMVDSNNVLGAQRVILSAVKKEVDGYAEAQRKTLGGAQKALGVALDNTFELDPSKTEALRVAIEGLITAIKDPAFQEFAAIIGTVLVAALAKAVDGITYVVKHAREMAEWLVLVGPALALPFTLAGDAIKKVFGVDVLDVVKDGINIIIRVVLTAYEVTVNAFGSMGSAISAGFKAGANVVIDSINFLVRNAVAGINIFIGAANALIRQIPESLRKSLGIDVITLLNVDNYKTDRYSQAEIDGSADALERRHRDSEARIAAIWKKDFVKDATDAISEVAKRGDLPGNQYTDRAKPPPPLDSGARDKAAESYKKIVRGAQEYIEKLNQEADAVGLSQKQQDELRHSIDLLNKAKNANINLTAAQRAELLKLAADMASADQAMRNAKFMEESKRSTETFLSRQEMERAALFQTDEAAAASRYEWELLNNAKKAHVDLSPAVVASLHEQAEAMAASEAQTKRTKEITDVAKDAVKGFVTDTISLLKRGELSWASFAQAALDALGKVADKLLSMALDGLLSGVLKSLGGAFGNLIGGGGGGFAIGGAGGGFGGWSGAGIGAVAAKGAVFRSGNVVPFSRGGVVNQPTLFPMNDNKVGLMGEAGDEGVFPLARDGQGRLGVRNRGGQQKVLVQISLDNELLRAVARDESNQVVQIAAPKIVKESVKQSRDQVMPTLAQNQNERGGDFRVS